MKTTILVAVAAMALSGCGGTEDDPGALLPGQSDWSCRGGSHDPISACRVCERDGSGAELNCCYYSPSSAARLCTCTGGYQVSVEAGSCDPGMDASKACAIALCPDPHNPGVATAGCCACACD
jgi:hypothetical protein